MRRDAGRGELLDHVTPPGARLDRERDIAPAGEVLAQPHP
jgi:hypothetical protein